MMWWWLVAACGTTGAEGSQAHAADGETPSVASEVVAPAPAEATAPAEPVVPPAPPGWETPLPEAAAAAGIAWPVPDVRLHVDKSDRRLTLYSGETPVKAYRVGLGGAPEGDKVRQGDQRTPDGTFRIVTRNDRSRYHLFLGISYPTAEDADRGLRDGLVSAAQATSIRDADAAGVTPPWNTTLGGAIGIHGKGGDWDWTLGCIAVDDHEIEELWEVVPVGTELVIEE